MTASLKDLYDQGRHQEVIEAAARANIPPAANPLNSLIVAASLLQMGHLQQCFQVCEALATVLATNPQFLSLYATCLRRLGHFDQSETIFQNALNQYPDLPYLNNNYANLLIEKGELAKAQQILEAVLKDHPSYADAVANLQRLKALPAGADTPSQLSSGPIKQAADTKASGVMDIAQTAASSPSAGATTEASSSDAPRAEQPQPQIVDPLDLAFSEEEVEVEQRERRKRKAEAAARKCHPPQAWAPLVTLPPVPAKELQEELVKAGSEAIAENRPDAALLLADLLKELGTEAGQEALQIAADAYLMLKRYPQAEIALLNLAASGAKLDVDQILNIAGLALKHNNFQQASYFLEQARKLDPNNERLEKINTQIEALKSDKRRLTFHPYELPQPK